MGLRDFLNTLGGTVAAPGGAIADAGVPAHVDPTPAAPADVGDSMRWIVAKSGDAQSVAVALSLSNAHAANWRSGLAAVREQPAGGGWLFVSSPLDGWVFVAGPGLCGPDQRAVKSALEQRDAQAFDRRFAALYGRFTDVQFFGNEPAAYYFAWGRAVNGRVVRMFASFGGKLLANVGQQTAAESALKLPNLSGLSLPSAEQALLKRAGRSAIDAAPIAIAAAWGVHPMQSTQGRRTPSVGFIARLP